MIQEPHSSTYARWHQQWNARQKLFTTPERTVSIEERPTPVHPATSEIQPLMPELAEKYITCCRWLAKNLLKRHAARLDFLRHVYKQIDTKRTAELKRRRSSAKMFVRLARMRQLVERRIDHVHAEVSAVNEELRRCVVLFTTRARLPR